MGLIDFIFGKRVNTYDSEADFFEFCPRCDANLTLQKGYHNDLPYWNCRGCGEMLINPSVETENDIAWICERCEAMLNEQSGFTENYGIWECTECGFGNKIGKHELYSSEEEYQASLKNPYKGMSDEDLVALMSYEEIGFINDREDIMLVKDEYDKVYIKKILSTYNESVYYYLIVHSVAHMPRLYEAYKGDKYLVIIEEYIEGFTISELLKKEVIKPSMAVRIARDLCVILNELHNLKKPIIHRDIKPSNVMLNEAGEVILLDVNVAKWYDADEKEDTRLLGTMYYAAPEQFGYGMSASSEKTDIYAVGVLLNVMLTGKIPKEEPVKGELWSVVERCICLEAKNRYTASELIEVLNGYLR